MTLPYFIAFVKLSNTVVFVATYNVFYDSSNDRLDMFDAAYFEKRSSNMRSRFTNGSWVGTYTTPSSINVPSQLKGFMEKWWQSFMHTITSEKYFEIKRDLFALLDDLAKYSDYPAKYTTYKERPSPIEDISSKSIEDFLDSVK